MRITISGMPGSGKSTVAKILSKDLNLTRYYAGAMWRKIAKEKGLLLDDALKKGEDDPSVDREVDDWLVKIGKEEKDFIVEGRTACHFIPDSIKVFIAVDPKVGAERIFKDINEKGMRQERNEKTGSDMESQTQVVKERTESDRKRYLQYYDYDYYDKKNYDIWIDTTEMKIEEVISALKEKIKKFCA